MAILFDPHFQATYLALPASGAQLHFYEAGTTTRITTYQDSLATTPHTNPVSADAEGLFPPIFLATAASYKIVLQTAAGVTIQTVDRIPVGEVIDLETLNQIVEEAEEAALRAEAAAAGVEFPVSYGLPQTLTDSQKQQARTNILAGKPWELMFRWLASRFIGYERRIESLERSRQRAAAEAATDQATNVGSSNTVVVSFTIRATSNIMKIEASARMSNTTGGSSTGFASVGIQGKTASTELFQSFGSTDTGTLNPFALYVDLSIGTEYTVELYCRQATATAGFNITGDLMAWSI